MVLAYLGLLYQYRSKWRDVLSDIGDSIVSYNVRHNYNRKLLGSELAKSYVHPLQGERLREYAVSNSTSPAVYERELDENIGKPVVLIGGFVFHFLATLFILSGLTYLIPGASISAVYFLLIGGGLLIVSIAAYLLG